MPLVPCLTVAAGLALPVAATAYHLDRRRDETAAEMVSCLLDHEVENEPGCGDGELLAGPRGGERTWLRRW
jgi:hypothetical protein